jgi:hypothetical protein
MVLPIQKNNTMNLPNYLNYGMCVYDNNTSDNDSFKLGDVVINEDNEIGVIIQVHEPCEFRADMFGNVSDSEIRLATDKEIEQFRPNIKNQGTFKH